MKLDPLRSLRLGGEIQVMLRERAALRWFSQMLFCRTLPQSCLQRRRARNFRLFALLPRSRLVNAERLLV
jgi:hypothetical protein